MPYATRPDLPSIANLARAANLARQSSRPEDPVDLESEINTDYIPEIFLRGDVKVDERRHLIFATNHVFNVQCRAKICYLDGHSSTSKHTQEIKILCSTSQTLMLILIW